MQQRQLPDDAQFDVCVRPDISRRLIQLYCLKFTPNWSESLVGFRLIVTWGTRYGSSPSRPGIW
jgi:hypothetical protein